MTPQEIKSKIKELLAGKTIKESDDILYAVVNELKAETIVLPKPV